MSAGARRRPQDGPSVEEQKPYVVRDFDGDVVTRLHTLEQAISAASLLDGTYEEQTPPRSRRGATNSTRQPRKGGT